MKRINKVMLILLMFLLCAGCYAGITGRVIDGETQKPVEGAVVLAQWTKTHGLPGLVSHSVYKTEETETDNDRVGVRSTDLRISVL